MITGRYYTIGDVASILTISPRTIYRWTTEGKIPCAVNFGTEKKANWRFPIDEFEAWEREYRQENRVQTLDPEEVQECLVGVS